MEPPDKIGTGRPSCDGKRVLLIERVSIGYTRDQAALDDVSLSVAAGEIVAVVGPNGDITSYSVIFVKKNVFEQMHMEGTTTDYEVLKTIAQTAAGRIQ